MSLSSYLVLYIFAIIACWKSEKKIFLGTRKRCFRIRQFGQYEAVVKAVIHCIIFVINYFLD